MRSVNPATGEPIREYEDHGGDYVDARLELAASAYRKWRLRPLPARCEVLSSAAQLLRQESEEHAQLMSLPL